MTASIIDEHDRITASELWATTNAHRLSALKNLGADLLTLLGYDPASEDMRDTPERWAKMWDSFINYEPGECDTAFDYAASDQMVVVKGMRVWSMCEHHLLPFWCDISVGYIARGKVLGLSKFARIAHKAAHRLQIQERLVEQIAAHVREATSSEDVAVSAEGEHLCMTMRGIKTEALMHSSSLHGCFRDSASARAEFFALVNAPARKR